MRHILEPPTFTNLPDIKRLLCYISFIDKKNKHRYKTNKLITRDFFPTYNNLDTQLRNEGVLDHLESNYQITLKNKIATITKTKVSKG